MTEEATAAERKRRRDIRLRRGVEVLAGTPGGLLWSELWEQIKDVAPITEDDLVLVGGKQPRGENNARWYLIDLAKARWIVGHETRLKATVHGRHALEQYPDPKDFMDEADRLYREWDAIRLGANFDPQRYDLASEVVPIASEHELIPHALGAVLRRGLSTGNGSFAEGVAAWSSASVVALHEEFVVRARVSSKESFMTKLDAQLAGLGDGSRLLMAELLAVILAPMADWHKDTKRNRVNAAVIRMDDPAPMTMEVSAAMDRGLINGGVGFKSGLFARISESLDFLRGWTALTEEARIEALASLAAFHRAIAPLMPEGAVSAIFSYLLFPRSLTPVISKTHADQIISAFGSELSGGRTAERFVDVGRIAMALQQELGQAVDFYEEPVHSQWVPPEPSDQGVWLVRGSSVEGANLIPGWLSEGYVSLRGKGLSHLPEEASRADIQEAIGETYANREASYRRQKATAYDRFLRLMQPDDLVLTTAEDLVHVGRVTGGVEWAEDSPMPDHLRRPVAWLTGPGEPIAGLPGALAARLETSEDVAYLAEDRAAVEPLIPGIVTPARLSVLMDPTEELAKKLHLPLPWLLRVTTLVNRRKQVILFGPPGTGKTYVARAIAKHWTEAGNTTLVQFHPSVAYEDFVEGYRPVTRDDGQVAFELRPGPFMRLAEQARDNPSVPHVLIIDEINRATWRRSSASCTSCWSTASQHIDLLYTDDDMAVHTARERLPHRHDEHR